MVRVLHVVGTMNRGGIETMLMNFYRNIDRDKYFRIDADVYIDGEPLLPKLNQQYLTGAQK